MKLTKYVSTLPKFAVISRDSHLGLSSKNNLEIPTSALTCYFESTIIPLLYIKSLQKAGLELELELELLPKKTTKTEAYAATSPIFVSE